MGLTLVLVASGAWAADHAASDAATFKTAVDALANGDSITLSGDVTTGGGNAGIPQNIFLPSGITALTIKSDTPGTTRLIQSQGFSSSGSVDPKYVFGNFSRGSTTTLTDINFDRAALGIDLGDGGGLAAAKLSFTGAAAPTFKGSVYGSGKTQLLLTHFAAGTHTIISSANALAGTTLNDLAVYGYRLTPAGDQLAASTQLAARLGATLSLANGNKDVVLTTTIGNTANTIEWSGMLDNVVGNNALNWFTGSNQLNIYQPIDTLVFRDAGSVLPVNSTNLTLQGDANGVLKAAAINVSSEGATKQGALGRDYTFSGAALELSATGSTGDKAFNKSSFSTLVWNAPTGATKVHKMNGLYNGGGGTLTLVGDHKFAPYTAGGTMMVNFGTNGATYNNNGKISFERAQESIIAGNANIGNTYSLTFTGATQLEMHAAAAGESPLKLGATGQIQYDNVAGTMILGADKMNPGMEATATADGSQALKLDGSSQYLTVNAGGRLRHTNKNLTLKDVTLELLGGAFHEVNETATIDRAGVSLHVTTGGKVVLGNNTNDLLNSTLKVSGAGADLKITEKLVFTAPDRTMKLTDNIAKITLADNTVVDMTGIDLNKVGGPNGQVTMGDKAQINVKDLVVVSTSPAYGGNINFTAVPLTAGVDAKVTSVNLTAANKSSLTMGDRATVSSSKAMKFDNSSVATGTDSTLSSGSLTMTNGSKATMGDKAAASSTGAASLSSSEMLLGEQSSLSTGSLTMTNASKVTMGNKATVTNGGAASLSGGSQLLVGDASGFSTGTLAVAGPGSKVVMAGKGKLTSTGLVSLDDKGLILMDDDATVKVGGLNAVKASSFTIGDSSSFTSTGDVTLDKSTLLLGDSAKYAAVKSSVANGGLLQVGDSSTMSGTSFSLNKGTLYMGAESRLTSTDFSLKDSTLKLKPGNSGAFITAANLPTLSGANALDFQAVPNGTFVIMHTTDADPDHVFKAASSTDTFTGRVTVNGGAITGGGRVKWKGLEIRDDGKSIVASADVDNTKLTWNGGPAGNWNNASANWKGSDTRFVMGDQATFAPAANTVVTLDNNITAGDVVANVAAAATSLTLTGADLYINGDNVIYDNTATTPGTGTLTKQGAGSLIVKGSSVAMRKGDIQAGSLALVDGGGIAGLASDERGVITVASGATLASAAGAANNNIGPFADVTVKKGGFLTLGKGLDVSNLASLTLEEGVLPYPAADFAYAGTMIARGYGAAPAAGVTLNPNGIAVSGAGRWAATDKAQYKNNMNVSVAKNGMLEVNGNGSHVFAGSSVLNMANGSVLLMDLSGRTAGASSVAAIDTSGLTTGSATIKNVTVMIASKDIVKSEKYLMLNSGKNLNGDEFNKNILFVDSTTLKVLKPIADNTASVDYATNAKQAWLNASMTPPAPPVPPVAAEYVARFNDLDANGRPNVKRALHPYTPATFADQVAASSSWFQETGKLLTTKEILANEILKDSKNMTPEGILSAGMANVQAYTSLRNSFLNQLFAGTPSLTVSTNSLQFSGLDSPHSAERMLGSFRGASGFQSQAQSDRLGSSLAGLGDLVSSNFQSNSLFNNWKPAQESTRGMLTDADQFIANAVNDKVIGYGLRFFGGYLGNFSNVDNQGGYAGYDSTQNGFMLGASLDFNEHFSMGGFVAYTTGETDFDSIDANVDTDATQVGLALTYKVGNGFRVTGDVGYGHFENDYTRKLTVFGGGGIPIEKDHKASPDQDIWSLGLNVAFDWNPEFSPATTITPYAELRYTNSDMDSFTEDGDILPTRVHTKDYDSLTSVLGIALAHDFLPKDNIVITPRLSLGWVHEYGDTDMSSSTSFVNTLNTVGSFKTRSAEIGTDRLQAGTSIDVLLLNKNDTAIGLKLMYGAEVGDNGVNQNVFGGIEFRF